MSELFRPRRSVLYMPGSNARALEKSKTLDADALILDLEDAVAPEEKDLAREQVVEAVKSGEYGDRELIIRINPAGTPWATADLEAAIEAGPDAVLVPKVNTAADIHQVGRKLAELHADAHVRMWAMMETPLAMLNAGEIAAAAASQYGRRLAALVMGTNDLAKDSRARLIAGRQPMLGWLSNTVVAARSYGLDIIDGVFNDLDDMEGFEAECAQGRDFGMDGKTLIHPRQLGPCNVVFAPPEEDIAWSRKVIAAFEEPENEGKGVIKIGGKMVELLHLEMARRTVHIAEAIAAKSAG
ncbi:citrate lyase subunit beta/citryl-CoA lyase [Rhodobium orientis]|uniref:CoA ester lyase n=1 Tax=Rhodobium orientis TaxID=34017 RepID=A0A327JQS7_9HYPH|nr:CoA ester lyase [Rhodobium orientis]MBB4304336.1 citrate lyase subunit beta/citryl-CoA lyase [Rhodobium orientis]MBK5948170.1 CoA ester lyase [Rhodobium orientis]RAI28830.1 CoA ester lyase [Rhodobium orientis]